MNQVYNKKESCCGCTACMNICPKNAISMVEDEEGFKYPKIDEAKCIKCGLCKRVCPVLNSHNIKNPEPSSVYAIKHKDDKVREKSSSGGAFTVISDYVLENDGVVYGVIYDNNMNIIHTRLTTKKERNLARGSKYVQSDLKDVFKEIKKDLNSNKLVLFTGTPCQNAGLKLFLGKKEYNNLILCDLVCHGTTSPLMWKERIQFLNKNGKVKNYYFRDKIKGWHKHTETIVYENKIDNTSTESQIGKELFYSHLTLRPSCYQCPFTTTNRVTDITIADFRGIEKSMPEFDDDKGISLVLINTEKGKNIFKKTKNNIIYKESNINDCIQPQLKHPSKKNPKRQNFWYDYNKKGYEYTLKKYTSYGFKKRIINKTKKTIKSIISKKS